MADGMSTPFPTTAPLDVLEQLVGEFAWLSDQSLAGIAAGGSAGFVTAGMARALIAGREMVALASRTA